MSNRIDFYAPQQNESAIPSMKTSILLDGVLCPFLELVEIVRSGYPEFSWAKFRYNRAGWADGTTLPAEKIENILGTGKSICVQQVVNDEISGVTVLTSSLFNGHIESIETNINLAGENIEVIAKDVSATLKRVTVYGRRIPNSNGSIFLTGLETIFNENGKADASNSTVDMKRYGKNEN